MLIALAFSWPVAAQEPGLTVAAWLERVQRQVFPYRVGADWFLLPAAEPGVATELGRVIDSNLPVELRARAVRALGQLAIEPNLSVPKLGGTARPQRREAPARGARAGGRRRKRRVGENLH